MPKINLIVFLLSLTEAGVQLLLPPFLQAGHFAVASVGYHVSFLAVGRLLSRFPGAFLYGFNFRGAALMIALLLVSVTTILFSFCLPAELIGFVILVHGFCYGLVTTILLALCMEIIGDSREAAGMMGWYTAFTSAGNSLGSLLAGFLVDQWGMAVAFASMAVFAGVTVLFVSIIPWPVLVISKKSAKPGRDVKKISIRETISSVVQFMGKMPLPVYLGILLAFYINFLNQMNNTFYPLWALQCGLTLTLVGLLKSVNSATGTLVRLFLGVILRYVNYRLLNHICLISLGLATSLLACINFFPALMGIFFTLGTSRAVVRATSATYAAENAPAGSRLKGLVSGVYSAGLDVGNILGPTIGGLTVHMFGLSAVFWVLPVFLLIPCLVLALWVEKNQVKKEDYKAFD